MNGFIGSTQQAKTGRLTTKYGQIADFYGLVLDRTEFHSFTITKIIRQIVKVLLENVWNSKQMIAEGEAAIPLETTLHASRNQEKTKQRSTIDNRI